MEMKNLGRYSMRTAIKTKNNISGLNTFQVKNFQNTDSSNKFAGTTLFDLDNVVHDYYFKYKFTDLKVLFFETIHFFQGATLVGLQKFMMFYISGKERLNHRIEDQDERRPSKLG